MNHQILVVDDDPHILSLIQLYLKSEKETVITATDGEEALRVFQNNNPDMVILDLMLPKKSGYEVLKTIRRDFYVPIIILTARGETFDKVLTLELGADDFIAKPFEPQELLAQVKALFRRNEQYTDSKTKAQLTHCDVDSNGCVCVGNLQIDLRNRDVLVDGNSITLAAKEFELLFFLVSHPNQLFTRDELLKEVWEFNFRGSSRTVDVHVARLRSKCDQFPREGWEIKTVFGSGYRFITG